MAPDTRPLREAFGIMFPEMPADQRAAFATELTRFVRQGLARGLDFSRVELVGRGGRPLPELSATLKKLRTEAGLRLEDVAPKAGWTSSKLSRIENGDVGVAHLDLLFLLRTYKVRDRALITRLTQLAAESRRQGWHRRLVQ